MRLRTVVLLACVWCPAARAVAQDGAPNGAPNGAPDGALLYRQSCAQCHDAPSDRAPSREALREMSPARVLAAMDVGPMISMAVGRTAAERRAVAEFVTGKTFEAPLDTVPPGRAMCSPGADDFGRQRSEPAWNGWGQNLANTRFQDAAGLSPADVPRLTLKWAFGFPGDLWSNAQAAVAGDRVFVGSAGGIVYALSASTGCVHWFFQAAAAVRSALSIGRVKTGAGVRQVAFFGDAAGTAYAVDASTGTLVWRTRVETHAAARITGSPVLYDGKLYVPVSSSEEGSGSMPDYECCRFRGSVVALDAGTGKQIWKSFTIVEEPSPRKRNKAGTQLWGPSGAPIWSSPAIDAKRNVLYVTTGDNYSDPPTRTSDAFLAIDLGSGKIVWSRQTTTSDAYVSACRLPDKTNCPDANGPDFDYAASPMLVTLPGGRRAVIAGQKSGIVYAVDPDRQGELIWQTRVGQGGSMGGVQWGSAADKSNLYVALSDVGRVMLTFAQNTDVEPKRGGGMFALQLLNGERVWYTAPADCRERPRCSPAQSAAVSALPGIAFSGSVDGHLRAYSTIDGAVVWDVDTVRSYETVNGVPARGGSLDGPGPAIGHGMIFVNSGYHVAGGMPGNVLLAFSVDGR